MSAAGVVQVRDLVKVYDGTPPTTVLRGLDLDVGAAELIGLIGPSGCGKSTLLRILAGLDEPTAGSVLIDGRRIDGTVRADAVAHRRSTVGIVRQGAEHNLVTHLDAVTNVALAAGFAGTPRRLATERAAHLLDLVGLGDRVRARPSELSGGQQQRVAIAAALINEPTVVLADEPTSALDGQTTVQIWDLLDRLRRALGTTIVVVSHEHALADHVDRVVQMHEGSIAAEHSATDVDGHTVVDQRGRVRLPPDWLAEHGQPDRVRVERRGDELVIRRPPEPGDDR